MLEFSCIFAKIFDKNWDCRAVQRNALCRSRRELSNAYLLAKFGFDTAENEPCKVCPLSVYRSPRCLPYADRFEHVLSVLLRLWGVRPTRQRPVSTHDSRVGELARSSFNCSRGRSLRGSPPLSWKVRYRTFHWFFSQMIKLYKARSLLYRRQFLQEIFVGKLLARSTWFYMLLHRSDLNIPEEVRPSFCYVVLMF